MLSSAVPATTNVVSGTAQTGVDLGLFTSATITGTVYNDTNADGTRQSSEAALSAKTVYIDANNNGVKDSSETSVTSNSSGLYTLSGLTAGPYTVRVVVTAGSTLTSTLPAAVTLTSGQTKTEVDFGVHAGALPPSTTTTTTPGGSTSSSGGSTTTPPAPTDAVSVNSGYWMATAEGGVFAYGDAGFFGSAVPFLPSEPIVGLAPTSTNNGYFLVARDGGIFAFGDAKFYGSMGGKPLNKPMVGMAATPTGSRLLDGGV